MTSIFVLVAFTFTSVPVYAEELDVTEVTEIETTEENNVEEINNEETLEVSVTLISEEPASNGITEPEVTETEVTEETATEVVATEEAPSEAVPIEDAATEEVAIEDTAIETVPSDVTPTEEVPTEMVPTAEVTTEEVKVEETSSKITSAQENAVIEEPVLEESVTEESITKETTLANAVVVNNNQNVSSGSTSKDSNLATDEYMEAATGEKVKYTKTIESYSTSESYTGRYNVNFTVLEKNENTGEVKKYLYTVSGFKNLEDVNDYLDGIRNDNYYSTDIIYRYNNDNLIDAEKKPWGYAEELEVNPDADPNASYDSNLCWAGSVSDMLVLSGWNKAELLNNYGIDVSDEDAILDYLADSFSDNAGNADFGVEWFFNGMNLGEIYDGFAKLKCEEGYSKALLSDYWSLDFVKGVYRFDEEHFGDILKSIDSDEDGDRCALGLIIGYYKMDEEGNYVLEDGEKVRAGGHCITIAGYSTDENGVPTSLTLIDSDSYNGNGVFYSGSNDRRSYKNTYTTYPLKYFDGNWHLMNYYAGYKYDTIIDEIDILKYYSDNTKNKVETEGTKDCINNVDLYAYEFLTYQNETDDWYDYCNSVYEGDLLRTALELVNYSTICYNLGTDNIEYRLIISKDGNIVRTLDCSNEVDGEDFSYGVFSQMIMDENSPLEAGEYTISYIINPNRTITEAYYRNNTSVDGVKFIVLKRVDENGNTSYVVIPEEKNSEENSNNSNNEWNTNVNSVVDFLNNIDNYSITIDKSCYESNPKKKLEFHFTGGSSNETYTDEEIATADILYGYSVTGDEKTLNGGFGGTIAANVTITKDDFSVERNADGSIKVVFTNEFIRKLPKGTHYFKLIIGGKTKIFKVEIK